MNLRFEKVSNFQRGTLFALLSDAYSFDPRYARCWSADWRAFDDFFFDHLQIADRCGIVTTLSGNAIGFASWDPRKKPMYVEIGHNCIVTAHKGKGYGTLQMREAVRRMAQEGAREILVTTNAAFLPASNMYRGVGMRECGRRKNEGKAAFAGDFIDLRMPCETITAQTETVLPG